MSPDRPKDQSYFLFMLPQEQLSTILFPLAAMTKNDVRRYAREYDLHIQDRAESQEICFIPDNNYISFLENYSGIEPSPGNIVNSSGKVLGRHNGIYRYTIGQRRGMGISAPEPLYVTSIDAVTNTVTAGSRDDLFVRYVETENAFDMKYEIRSETSLLIKARSTQVPVRGTVSRNGDRFMIVFDEPQTGISPGQCAVFYDSENDIAGGGFISKSYS
jgi:tRNA-specific 2-thiouridylase